MDENVNELVLPLGDSAVSASPGVCVLCNAAEEVSFKSVTLRWRSPVVRVVLCILAALAGAEIFLLPPGGTLGFGVFGLATLVLYWSRFRRVTVLLPICETCGPIRGRRIAVLLGLYALPAILIAVSAWLPDVVGDERILTALPVGALTLFMAVITWHIGKRGFPIIGVTEQHVTLRLKDPARFWELARQTRRHDESKRPADQAEQALPPWARF